MKQPNQVIVLKDALTLSKEGYEDIHYEEGTLLKVVMISNDHVVVQDDNNQTFILKFDDQHKLWEYI
ncbi:hypothetical protein MKI79_07875 [Acinetobacter sp. A3.8]|uniref:Uncharacterized protein n=1 Tax=Acinetobacter sedimenti TaxID=2919922 RepID=A0A9X1WZA9_9GAMM|nr:hypothetical protein [Acinetobacter sedimenti]MCJ8146817.1 hypothetical protein [Acinetobacter sedimenti]